MSEKGIRKTHSSELKFKVAIEAIKNDLTVAEIMSKYGVAKSLIHKWRKQLLEGGKTIFRTKNKDNFSNVENLHSCIGRLKVENDFLEKLLSKSSTKRG